MSKTAFIFIPLLGGMMIGSIITNIVSKKQLQQKEIEIRVGDCIGGTSVGEILKIYNIGTNTVSTRSHNKDVIFNKKSLLKSLNKTSTGVYIYKCDDNMDEL
jgi:patatin-like phospholipase/acyl hydrolase